MPDNATLNQQVQIGVQSVLNTGVPATKRLQTITVDLDVQTETDTFFPNGSIFPSSVGLNQEWTEGDVGGVLTYTEVIYPLTMLFGTVAPTTIGTNGKKWTWAPAANAVLSPTMMSLEKGSSVYGIRAINAIMTGLDIGWSRTDRIELGGSILASAITPGFTMTTIASNATVPIVRVMPPQISVYYDPTFGALGTTKQLRAFEASLSISDLYAAVWPLNAALTGLDGYVPTQPSSESTLLLMADAAGLAFLTAARAGSTGYLRIEAVGPALPAPDAAFNYKFTVDMAIQISDVGAFEDSNGIYAIPFTFQPINDGTNPPLSISTVNLIAAL